MTTKLLNYYLEILNSFNKNSTFKYLEPLNTNTKNNKNETIRYSAFKEETEYGEKYTIFILHKDTNIKATCNYIANINKDIIGLKKHIIFFFRGKRTTDTDEKIISSTLHPKKTYKIEEIIKRVSENLISDVFDKEKFITPNAFVFPKIRKYLNKEKSIQYDNFNEFRNSLLEDWFNDNNKPILVIKGQGGIGKTTIAKYFSNYFLDRYPHTAKIFIDSLEAKNYLLDINKKKSSHINLFDLYKASLNGENYLDNKLFVKNLDAGNFFIIIDGIDELISKVNNFDIDIFLDSIKEYYSEIKNTKIIITCRTYFWDLDSSNDYKIESIEILPFNEEQTNEFFWKSFKGDTNKIKKANKLAIDFHKNNKKDIYYHPYALDIISRIIISNKNVINENIDTFSKLLNPNETLDYIVDRICNRENYLQDKVRILDLSVDEQIRVFKNIAVKYNGQISIDLIENCISNSISTSVKKNIPKSLVEAFKTHLLIEIKNNIVSFKYDFLNDFFKSIYIANFFNLSSKENESISQELINLFYNSTFGSALTKEVPRRLIKWTDDEKLKLSYLIDNIKDQDIRGKIKIFSGIFNIAYSINSKFNGNNTIENTKLIIDLFGGSKSYIENLCLVNVFDSNNKIKFDFSDKTLNNCHFINYYNFWECTFNENVFFTNCTLKKLGIKKDKSKIPFDINKNVDKNCKFDETFRASFDKIDYITEEYKKNVSNFIDAFLRFFYTRGTLWSRNFQNDQGKYNTFSIDYASFGDINIDFPDFVELMKKIGLIRIFYHKKHQVEKVEIQNKYKSDIVKYVEEQVHSEIINKIKETLYNYIRE